MVYNRTESACWLWEGTFSWTRQHQHNLRPQTSRTDHEDFAEVGKLMDEPGGMHLAIAKLKGEGLDLATEATRREVEKPMYTSPR